MKTVDDLPRKTRRIRERSTGSALVVRVALFGGLALALVYPLIMLFRQSVQGEDGALTFEHYRVLIEDPMVLEAIGNSFWIGIGTVIGSAIIAAPMAFLVSRTDLPYKNFLRGSVILTFAAPSFIAALGWIMLLGRNGLLNNAIQFVFGLEEPPINIFTPWGIIFVLSTLLYPLFFLPLTAAFENIDAALEQAASSLGASRFTVFRAVTIPLVTPALFGGALLVFVDAFVIFGPVAILGAPAGFRTVPIVLLELISAPPRIDAAAVMSVPVFAIVLVIFILQRKLIGRRRYTVIGGKAGPRHLIRLGRAKIPALIFVAMVFVVTLVLPFGSLALTSFRRAIGAPLNSENLVLWDNYRQVLNDPQIVSAISNSLILGVSGAAVAVLVALMAAWLVRRTKSRTNVIIGPTMLASLAFPGAVLAIGLVIAFSGPPFLLGGTLVLLLIGYVIRLMPLTYLYTDAAMSQIGPELEEASRSLGANWLQTVRKVTLPLLRPSLVAVFVLGFVILFRELEMSIFLYTGSNPTIATLLYHLSTQSRYQAVGALSVMVLVINLAAVLISIRLLGVKGVK